MIPIRLTLSGFLSYKDEVDLDFTSFDLACISGANGAGKSSLLDGITWSLFGQARKRDDSIINLQSDAAVVDFEFDYENNRYRVQRNKVRGKSTILEFQIRTEQGSWKPLSERTLRGTEEKIEKTLRLDYETFVNASFFLQGKADQFTQQRPGDRKRILSSILGLEMWESYRKHAANLRRQIDQRINELDGRLQEIHTELGEENQRKARLNELETNLKALSDARATQEKALGELRKQGAAIDEQRKLVQTLANNLDRARASFNDMQARLALRETEKNKYDDISGRAKDIEANFKAWQTAQTELEKLEETAAQFREHDKQRAEPRTQIETERARLESERDQLNTQASAIIEIESQLKTYDTQRANLQKELDKASTWQKEREAFETDLNSAREKQAAARAENPRLKAEMEELRDRINQLKATKGATCPLCGQPMEEADRQRLIEELTTQGNTMGNTFRANTALLKETDDTVSTLEKQISTLKTQENAAQTHLREYEAVSARIEQGENQQSAWGKDGANRLTELERKLKEEDFAQDARKTLAATDAELIKIGYEAALHDEIRRTEQTTRNSGDALRELEAARAALAPLEREIKETQKQIDAQTKEIDTQESAYTTAATNLATAESGAPNVQEAQRKMLDMQEQENHVRDEVGMARQLVNVLDDLRVRVKELEVEREEHARQVAQHKSIERAFGKDGVPAMLIEQALPQIETKANEILERLSGGTMSIRFITQLAYKDKKREDMKETLDIQISDSAGIRDYEMYSGGEAFRINFAIRLALSEVLAQRAGARLQTLVIDEGFGSQDEAGRQRLVEAINLVKNDFAKILIITHIDSLKDVFPTRIEVEKSENGSFITVV